MLSAVPKIIAANRTTHSVVKFFTPKILMTFACHRHLHMAFFTHYFTLLLLSPLSRSSGAHLSIYTRAVTVAPLTKSYCTLSNSYCTLVFENALF